MWSGVALTRRTHRRSLHWPLASAEAVLRWVYGVRRFSADAIAMCGKALPKPLLWNIKFVIPLLLAGLLWRSAVTSIYGAYEFPPGGIACGWALALVCSAPTPFVAWRVLKPGRWLLRRAFGGGQATRVGDNVASRRARTGATVELPPGAKLGR